MKKNILFVHLTPGIGGGTICLYNTLAKLNKKKFNPIIVTYVKHFYVEKIKSLGIEVIILKKSFRYIGRSHLLSLLIDEIPFALKLFLLIIRKKIDLVHLNNDISRHTGSIIGGVFARKPILCTMRGAIGSYVSLVSKFISRYVDVFISVSEFVKIRDVYHELNYRKCLVIYDGIDIKKFRYNNPDQRHFKKGNSNTFNVGIVGNIHDYKGHHIFIQAAIIVLNHRKDVKFLIAGKDVKGKENYKKELTRYIDQMKLNSHIKFMGFVEDIPRFLSILDVFVCASIIPEAFGVVISEAMAMGLAVVAPNMGGPKELIEDSKNGLLIDPDNPKLLANSILKLLDDPLLKKRLGQNARKTIEEKLTIEKTVEQLETLYSETLNK